MADVTHWSNGGCPEDYGWVFDGTSITAFEIMEAAEDGWDGLYDLYIPEEILDEAKASGMEPSYFVDHLLQTYR